MAKRGGFPGPADLLRQGWMVLAEACHGWLDNGDLRQASSLAFYTTLALIPALLLTTWILAVATGSSLAAHARLTGYLATMVPEQADRVLAEVASVTRYPKAVGVVNVLVLVWSISPFVSALREIIRGIFKERDLRAYWITKSLDIAAGMTALVALAGIAGAGVLFHFIQPGAMARFGVAVPLAVTTVLVAAVLHMAAPRGVRFLHVLAGALATAVLWFLLRPAFTWFLTIDKDYGLAFGSFKSMFLIVCWVYVSMMVLLFGAEVAAVLHRFDALAIKRILAGKSGAGAGRRYLLDLAPGAVLFREGEPGEEMYYVMEGSVAIRKCGAELARIGPGRFFGEMTFLLGMERSATAVAAEPCRLVVVHGRNFNLFLRESPETVRDMLVEMAARLRDTNERARQGGIVAAPEEVEV